MTEEEKIQNSGVTQSEEMEFGTSIKKEHKRIKDSSFDI
jgi:hypothetical protein